ncbi:hypothetical protein GBAR_LOCUS28516, partial [Geodia barretti]
VCLSVCLSVTLNLTSRVFVRLTKDTAYFRFARIAWEALSQIAELRCLTGPWACAWSSDAHFLGIPRREQENGFLKVFCKSNHQM